ncbi:Beta-amyrin 28-monooxygenase [Camellia lanceoleosa]|uniref:Beta-amyrin 28-monooxygenase n=1 Tax=Camellia lanceoleosa TaxID=1840588 RepID=A0ACC0GFX1_9ERIC|nr:Beta-amyrin 28-monooxygenase [Camellia lanceoleosa]
MFTGFLPHSKQKLFLSSKPEPAAAPSVPPPQVVAAAAANDVKEVIRIPGFFKPKALSSYLGIIDSISQQHLKTHWEGKDELKVYPLAKTVTLSIACRIFLGMENRNRIARLVHYFDDVTLGLHSIMVNFPSTNFYRAGKAADAIRRELMAMVRERRAAMVGGGGAMKQDILSHMIVVSDPTGKGMGEAEIADKMMGLLVAGYANVAVTVSFFMKFVGESPDIYNKVLSKQLEISKDKKIGELLDWNNMSKMKYSRNVMCEVMRVVPPRQGTFKEILTDFTYAGYTIPKGWKVGMHLMLWVMSLKRFGMRETQKLRFLGQRLVHDDSRGVAEALNETEGATKEDIERLLKYKFRRIGDFEKQNGEIQESFGGIITECDTNSPIEHVLSPENVVTLEECPSESFVNVSAEK